MQTLFEHRYRLPYRKLLGLRWLCFALGAGAVILLAGAARDCFWL